MESQLLPTEENKTTTAVDRPATGAGHRNLDVPLWGYHLRPPHSTEPPRQDLAK